MPSQNAEEEKPETGAPLSPQQNPGEEAQEQATEMKSSNSSGFPVKKFVLWGIAALIIGSVAFASYYLGTKKVSLTKEPVMEQETGVFEESKLLPSPTVSELTDASDANLVPVAENTVSFARSGNQVLLRYRGKIYNEADQFAMQPLDGIGETDYSWYGLVNAPDFVTPGEFMYDEVFGLKSETGEKSFVFVMRWGNKDQSSQPISYYLYYYHPSNSPKLTLVHQFTPDSGSYQVPKIDQFSSDGNYLSLNIYGCWNCGGHQPKKQLVNLENLEMKNIGQVSYFKWQSNGAYEYKDYLVIPCDPPEQMGECSENPDSLPLKQGNF